MVSPQAAGFAPDLAKRLATGLRSGQLPDIHAVLVARRGRMVLEHYGSGRDEAWGRELGHPRDTNGTLEVQNRRLSE